MPSRNSPVIPECELISRYGIPAATLQTYLERGWIKPASGTIRTAQNRRIRHRYYSLDDIDKINAWRMIGRARMAASRLWQPYMSPHYFAPSDSTLQSTPSAEASRRNEYYNEVDS